MKELDGAGTPRTFPAIQALLGRETAETREQKPHPALVDMAARLRVVTESSAEPWLRPGPASLSLEAAIRDGRAVLFSVPVPRLKLVGEKLGAWLLAEANRVANVLTADDWGRRSGRRCLILVDEFARLKEQGAHVVEPLAAVREGGVSVWLFTQTWSDLERLGDDVLPQILGNCAVQVAFRQGEAHDQERLSAQLGEYRTQAFTRSRDGETGEATGNYRVKDVAARYVTPGQIAGLEVGQAYVRIGTRRPVAVRFPKLEAPASEEGPPSGEPPTAAAPQASTPASGGGVARGGPTPERGQDAPQEPVTSHAPGQRPGAVPDPFSLVD